MKKMAEVKEIIIRTRKEILELESKDSLYKEEYFQKYLDARKDSGLSISQKEQDTSFMKFLVEDAELGF